MEPVAVCGKYDGRVEACPASTRSRADYNYIIPPSRSHSGFGVNAETMDEFVSMMTGTLPVPEFFHPTNTDPILATAG